MLGLDSFYFGFLSHLGLVGVWMGKYANDVFLDSM